MGNFGESTEEQAVCFVEVLLICEAEKKDLGLVFCHCCGRGEKLIRGNAVANYVLENWIVLGIGSDR